MKAIITSARIEKYIYVFRNQTVMLDSDLAVLYGVPVKRLNEQVKRNTRRFPVDFMFRLNAKETSSLKFQNETSNLKSQFATSSWGGRRKLPYAFTEQGVAMLSSVLNSERGIQVNIHIMRAFTRLKGFHAAYENLRREVQKMRGTYDRKFTVVFDAISSLLDGPKKHFKIKGFETSIKSR